MKSIARSVWVLSCLCLGLSVVTSCNRGPRPIPLPKINAQSAGKQAMQRYDVDGDGTVSGGELDKAAALQAGLKLLDTDGNGGVSADEIAARVNAWSASKIPLTPLECTVKWKNQPLEGATVRLIPEEFLGDDLRPADGVTDDLGIAYLSIPEDNRSVEGGPSGVQFGLYRVEITREGGTESIPAKYNSETTLGLEVSYDNPKIVNPPLVFDLK